MRLDGDERGIPSGGRRDDLAQGVDPNGGAVGWAGRVMGYGDELDWVAGRGAAVGVGDGDLEG